MQRTTFVALADFSAGKLPVLVVIYGGGFNGGATSYPVHDGAKLAKRGGPSR